MYEGVFRVFGDGPYETATRGTDTTVDLWCNDHCDLLQIRGEATDAVLARVRETVGVRDHRTDGGDHVVVTDACLTAHTDDYVERHLARHGCLLLPPLTYEDGAKRCRVLALDPDALSACYRDLAENVSVDVESKRELYAVGPDSPRQSLDAALPSLTDRQREVVRTAHERGYYEIPRETTTSEIADAVGIERRTAEDHLRRAEEKLLDALVDVL